MRKAIHEYTAACEVCSHNKTETVASPGLLHPLLVLEDGFHDITMDFIEGLLKSEGQDVISVVVNWLTTYGHFMG